MSVTSSRSSFRETCLESFRTFARGLRGVTRAAVNAEPLDPDTIARRRFRCAGCPNATRTRGSGIQGVRLLSATSTCTVCKCAIQLKTKLAGEDCPVGQWDE